MPRATPAPKTAVRTAARKASAKPARESAAEAADKNRPLVDDIRLLGRILGDVIREQEGQGAFDLIERIRQLSVAYRLKRDAQAGKTFDRLLKSLSGDQTVSVIRAFSYFSHLANIAEDRHHVRRREHHERQGHLQEGSLAMSFERRFQFLDEQALAADLRQRAVEDLVTARRHAEQLDAQPEALLQQVAHVFGLPEGKAAFAGGDDEGFGQRRHRQMLSGPSLA